ncbi:hypothetical protein PGT21_028500 [Puccinia graminis f. sp. tritici]|uniref:Uncharacterized protein n=1 Tax=Puccinia graminis f. sp. tritici TaxID=56615 RepID=A0A5B0QXC0_PUCGR|nr:hypothetical protein PGT21_028481 [Puccinia graminis f. sp. tritici]KAA1117962.1 hypothetical protein PGT21_028500 [Puccinia graminis f. sp. tritici]
MIEFFLLLFPVLAALPSSTTFEFDPDANGLFPKGVVGANPSSKSGTVYGKLMLFLLTS